MNWVKCKEDVIVLGRDVMKGLAQEVQQLGHTATEAVQNNSQVVLVPVGLLCGTATGGLLMGPALGAIGFSSIGPVAGKGAFHGID